MDGDRRGPAPRGLIGLIGLVVAVELLVARHAPDSANLEGSCWRLGARAARRAAVRCEVLCFGDSEAKFAIQPAVLERRVGRRAYNLAVFAGQAPTSYFLLRRALAAGARPAALLVDFHGGLLAVGPRDPAAVHPWAHLLDARECLDLARNARDAELFAATMLAEALPSYRARPEIRASLRAALRGEAARSRDDARAWRRNWGRNAGAAVMPQVPRSAGADARAPDEPGAWKCHPVNREYARRFLTLAAGRGIPVFWLLPPVNPGVQARRDRSGQAARYDRFVRKFQDRFPNLVVVDGRHAGYGADLFVDANHLDRRGAAAFSDDVAAVVARTLADSSAPRWVALPSYRDRPVDASLEDLDQSALALQRGRGPRHR